MNDYRERCGECDKPRYQKYRLSKNMMQALAWFVDNPGWHNNVSHKVPREVLRVKNYALLRYWGLLYTDGTRDRWRATPLAFSFVRGEAHVRSHIMTEKQEFVCFSGKNIPFEKAVETEVSTEELATGWTS